MKLILKEGWGYYDMTNYPIGGAFRRAILDAEVTDVHKIDYKAGCNHIGMLNGIKIAFNINATKPCESK